MVMNTWEHLAAIVSFSTRLKLIRTPALYKAILFPLEYQKKERLHYVTGTRSIINWKQWCLKGGARGGHISTVVGCPEAGPVSRDKDTQICACILSTSNHLIFLEQFWINQHPQIYIEDYKVVFEKFTCGDVSKIALNLVITYVNLKSSTTKDVGQTSL